MTTLPTLGFRAAPEQMRVVVCCRFQAGLSDVDTRLCLKGDLPPQKTRGFAFGFSLSIPSQHTARSTSAGSRSARSCAGGCHPHAASFRARRPEGEQMRRGTGCWCPGPSGRSVWWRRVWFVCGLVKEKEVDIHFVSPMAFYFDA